jgi:hypothetical protein
MQSEHLLGQLNFEEEDLPMEEELEDLDSNDENHPDNDYPDEEGSENSDRSSEGIIRDYN